MIKNAITLGPNGAGKTNLFSALSLMRDLILTPVSDISREIRYQPFVLESTSINKPTTFYVKIIIEDIIYDYQFTYNQHQIIEEQLNTIHHNGTAKRYFYRNVNSDQFKGPSNLKRIVKTTRKNKLLLFDGQDYNDKTCMKLFNWFSDKLIIFKQGNMKAFEKLKDKKTKKHF